MGARVHPGRTILWAVMVLTALWWGASACRGGDDAPGPTLATAETVLFGGEQCDSDADCASRHCSYGICGGFLMAPTDAMRARMAPALREVARNDPGGLAAMLEGTLAERESDQYLRGRAADAMSFLPARTARRTLALYLDDPHVPVRFFAARSLHRLGDERGTRALRTFLEHPSQAVRMMASVALGLSGGDR